MPCGSWGSQTCSNARVPFLALRPASHDQPVFCFFVCFLARSLALPGPVVFGAGGDQRLHQCGVQRRFRPSAVVCRGRAHGGANRFEPAAIPFAGFVVHGAGAAGLRGDALAAGGRLAHGAGLALVQFQPVCAPCVGVGCAACPSALGRCGLDIGLVGFGHGLGTGEWKSKSANLS
jgi:hypothetical protein